MKIPRPPMGVNGYMLKDCALRLINKKILSNHGAGGRNPPESDQTPTHRIRPSPATKAQGILFVDKTFAAIQGSDKADFVAQSNIVHFNCC